MAQVPTLAVPASGPPSPRPGPKARAVDLTPPVLVLYGLAEIVELVDYSRTNTVRLRKQLPPPDVNLKMGPVWFGGTIKKWLAERSA